MKEFNLESLAKGNGQPGNPAYVAYRGRVINVSSSRLWKTGLHMNRHHAGNDLTAEIEAAPHGPEVLDRFPQVGILKKEEGLERPMPKSLSRLLSRFPLLRRHPHPMVVHFPIVFMYSATLFNLLFLITGTRPFEVTALHCLGGGILFTPVAILTGLFTWWLNYSGRPMRPVTIKFWFSLLLLVVSVITFIWRIMVPDVLILLTGSGFLYLLLVLSFIPLVTVIGWYGAKMTFPLTRP